MLFDKLRQIEERSNEIARALSDPAILAQPVEYARLRKEHAETVDIVDRFTEYREVLRRLGEARHLLSEGGDRELMELAQAEVNDLTARQTALEDELKRLLLPRDPNDAKNVFVEIRAGARSEEHTSELQSPCNLVCRLLLEKKKNKSLQTCQRS